jgi:hypothetical protein
LGNEGAEARYGLIQSGHVSIRAPVVRVLFAGKLPIARFDDLAFP